MQHGGLGVLIQQCLKLVASQRRQTRHLQNELCVDVPMQIRSKSPLFGLVYESVKKENRLD